MKIKKYFFHTDRNFKLTLPQIKLLSKSMNRYYKQHTQHTHHTLITVMIHLQFHKNNPRYFNFMKSF